MSSGKSISEQLRQRRQALGLSLADVARRASTSSATLSRYENGWTRFETYTLRKLAVALGCDLSVRLLPKSVTVPEPACAASDLTRLKRLFWDHPFSGRDLENHSVWVVARVLDHGTLEDVHALQRLMGKAAFLRSVALADRVSPRTRSFWLQILAMEGISCTRKYSRNTAWNS
jgi:transcriptional regulator with XRE-family HTH domain